MRIRTQFFVSMSIFGIVLLIITVTAILTNRQEERIDLQEDIAGNIEREANELGYLSNEYLLYGEDLLRSRWEAKWTSLSNKLSKLEPDDPGEKVIADNIRAGHLRLKAVFESVVTAGPHQSLARVSWSRMAVQNREIASDASQLSRIMHDRKERLMRTRSMLFIVMFGIFSAFFTANYLIVQRRLFRSIADLQAGTKIIGSGNLDFAVGVERDDEIGDLSRAFNRMTASLKEVTASKTDLEREIAERKQVEEALRESEERFRAVFESSSDCILVWDRQCNYLYANQAAIEHVGTTRDKVIGRNIRDGLGHVPEFMHLWMARVEQAFATGEPFRVEDAMPVGGRLVYSESQISPIRDATGRVFAVSVVYRDVTERKRYEEEIVCAKEEWERTFDSVPDMIALLDNKHSIIRVNRAMARQLGLKPEECAGMMCHEAVHGTAVPPAFCPHTRTLKDGREHVQEVRDERLGMDLLVTTTPLLDKKGEMIGSIHIAHDITERKRAENLMQARLRLAEVSYKEALCTGDILRLTLDELEVQTGSNIGFYHFLEEDQETLSLQNWSSNTVATMCTSEGAGSHYNISQAGVWVDCVREKRPVIHNDYSSLPHRKGMPPGHAPVVREMVVPIIRGERIVAIIGMGNKPTDYNSTDVETARLLGDFSWEIVERKRAEEALQESERRLNRSQEIAHLGSWELDLTNNRLYWSDEVYRIFGLHPQEFDATYESFLEAAHPDDREAMNEAYSASLREGRDTYEIEHRIVRKLTGEVRTVHEKCTHIRDESGRIIRSIGMVHDITERKKLQEERERLLKELTRSNKELEQFAYIASHDLQEPLRMVSSYVQLISHRYKGRLDKEADEFISYAVNGAAHMQELLNDLLAYSRVGTKGGTFKLISLKSALDRALINLKVRIDQTRAEIKHEGLPIVYADELQMVQVFQNLVSNAMKFCPSGTSHINVSAEMKDNEWVIRVKDNGIGIDPKYFDRIFHIFKRLHTKEEYQGTGIGLAICKKIIERHKGRIWVDSERGKGSSFYFTIPLEDRGKGSWGQEVDNGAGI